MSDGTCLRGRVVDATGGDAFPQRLAARLSPVSSGPRIMVARLDRVEELTAAAPEDTDEPTVFVGLWSTGVYVGPVWRSGQQGCPRCLAIRAANAPAGPRLRGETVQQARGGDRQGQALPPGIVELATRLVATRLPAPSGRDDLRVHILDARRRTIAAEWLVPEVTCGACGNGPRSAVPALTPPETSLDEVTLGRSRHLDDLVDVIEERYLGARLGFARAIRHDLQSPFGACSFDLPIAAGRREPVIGRAVSYRQARAISVLEGLERYCGLFGGRRRRIVRERYAAVSDHALDPRTLGLHPEESYQRPEFTYRPFDPEAPSDWVWAYSLTRDETVLVPERNVFYGHSRPEHRPGFCFETSSGCAVGASTEEATFHGLRELAERDAFLLTWYRRLALPEVMLDKLRDRELRALLRRCAEFTGARFRAFLATMEYGVPSLWLTAELDPGTGPSVLAGGGAHPDLTEALRGGLQELAGLALAVRHDYRERRDAGLRMLADPDRVRQMRDHALVNSLPEARSRFSFLLDGARDRVPLDELPGAHEVGDVRARLRGVLAGFTGAGLDVIVADQTTPETEAAGLRCVRVIVPGLVPVTFGHINRRVVGLPRLTNGPPGVGYRSQLKRGEEVGGVPHPFP